MNQPEPTALPIPPALQDFVGVTPGASPYQFEIRVYFESPDWGVMIGPNGQAGLCGYGATIPEALCELASAIEHAS